MITQEKKVELIKEYGRGEGDTGSPEVQIAIFSHRIDNLTAHLKENPKDSASRRGLYMLIGKRRGLLNYLEKKDIERYRDIVSKLKLRR